MRDFVASKDKPVEGDFHTRECGLFAEHYAWLQRESGQMVPPRKAFNPSQARALLPYISLAEIRGPRFVFVRLVGTNTVNRTHIDSTGRNLIEMLPEHMREWSWGQLVHVTETPCGLTFLCKEDYEHVSLWVEVLSFPLADADGAPRFILTLAAEVDRQKLALRGDQAMQIGEHTNYRYIDIGCGT